MSSCCSGTEQPYLRQTLPEHTAVPGDCFGHCGFYRIVGRGTCAVFVYLHVWDTAIGVAGCGTRQTRGYSSLIPYMGSSRPPSTREPPPPALSPGSDSMAADAPGISMLRQRLRALNRQLQHRQRPTTLEHHTSIRINPTLDQPHTHPGAPINQPQPRTPTNTPNPRTQQPLTREDPVVGSSRPPPTRQFNMSLGTTSPPN